MRKVKIVATIGPATDDPGIQRELIQEGLNVARLNFSHGTHESHRQRHASLKQIAGELGLPLAFLADLQGPKIRTGRIAGGAVELIDGSSLKITGELIEGTAARISTSYTQMPGEVKPGDEILLDDGKIRLVVTATDATEITTEVTSGGILRDNKAINLPGARISAPSLTEKDIRDLAFALQELQVEYIALSFVRCADDIELLRRKMNELGCYAGIIAKIEKPEAVDNIHDIMSSLSIRDGIMVARGDLGVECHVESVPRLQKQLIHEANNRSLLCITATQMLESMMVEPLPSRAETTDIFNAVLDGTDAVMLSGETAAGNHPVECVKMMNRIIVEAEKYAGISKTVRAEPEFCDYTFELATSRAACVAAEACGAKGLVAISRSGRTALLMSKLSMPADIPFFALSPEPDVYRRMNLYYGVTPLLMQEAYDPDSQVWDMVDEVLRSTGKLKYGDTVVIASGFKLARGHTNMCKIVRLGMREYY